MKIAIHSNQFDGRGTGKTPYDYGIFLEKYLNVEVIYVTSKRANNEGLNQISQKFQSFLYDTTSSHEIKKAIERIIDSEKVDFIHMIKAGDNDGITPENCKSGIHCVFGMNHPHGNVYAGVSEYLAKKFNKTEYVPHIIQRSIATEDYRVKYNIPKDAFVVGRHGGSGQFNIPYVRDVVVNSLQSRSDLYFLFLSTEKFVEHERAIFIPWIEDHSDVVNFIHACDCMLHARADGETFGLAVGEFSAANKPIITWSGLWQGSPFHAYEKSHLEILGDSAIIYNDQPTLSDILLKLDRSYILSRDWDKYSERFSPRNVIDIYSKTFLSQ
jgi:hypothetical protein